VGAAVEAHERSHPDEASWDKPRLEKLPKAELIDIILDQQLELHRRLQEKDRRIAELGEAHRPLVPVLRQVLQWDPELRPDGGGLERMLLAASEQCSGQGLRTWSRDVVPQLLSARKMKAQSDPLLGRTVKVDTGGGTPAPAPQRLSSAYNTFDDFGPPAAAIRDAPCVPVEAYRRHPAPAAGSETGRSVARTIRRRSSGWSRPRTMVSTSGSSGICHFLWSGVLRVRNQGKWPRPATAYEEPARRPGGKWSIHLDALSLLMPLAAITFSAWLWDLSRVQLGWVVLGVALLVQGVGSWLVRTPDPEDSASTQRFVAILLSTFGLGLILTGDVLYLAFVAEAVALFWGARRRESRLLLGFGVAVQVLVLLIFLGRLALGRFAGWDLVTPGPDLIAIGAAGFIGARLVGEKGRRILYTGAYLGLPGSPAFAGRGSTLEMNRRAIGPAGSDTVWSHDNVQPFQCINFIIALAGVYPSRP